MRVSDSFGYAVSPSSHFETLSPSLLSFGWMNRPFTPSSHRQPLVFIPGFNSPYPHNLWLARLNEPYAAMLGFDPRGQGNAPKYGRMDLLQQAYDLSRVIHHVLGSSPFFIEAHSLGSLIAATYLGLHFEHSSQVRGLILVSPITRVHLSLSLKLLAKIPWPLVHITRNKFADAILHHFFPPTDPEAFQRAKRIVDSLDPRATAILSKHWKRAHLVETWKRIEIPTVIIAGPHDNLTPLSETIKVWNLLQNACLFLVHSQSHMLLENNVPLLELIYRHFLRDPLDFLQQCGKRKLIVWSSSSPRSFSFT